VKLDGWLLAVCAARTCMTSVFMTYAAVLPVLRTEWGMSATAAGSISTGFQLATPSRSWRSRSWADRVGCAPRLSRLGVAQARHAIAFGLWARSYTTGSSSTR